MSLFRKIVTGAAALAAGAVSACDQAPNSRVVYMRPDGVRPFLEWATSRGPLLVETAVSPFGPDVAPQTVAEIVAQAVKTGVRGRAMSVTTDPAASSDPDHRVRVALGTDQGIGTAKALCRGEAPPVQAVDDRLTVLMVFCGQGEMMAAVAGHIPWTEDPAAPAVGKLVTQMSRAMFDDKPIGG